MTRLTQAFDLGDGQGNQTAIPGRLDVGGGGQNQGRMRGFWPERR
nr:hypothetical protein [Kibdelosporangium aridum]